MIQLIKKSNGKTLKINIFNLSLNLNKINIGSFSEKFSFQFNRFENGFCELYICVFSRYFFTLNGLRLSQGKRFFWGTKKSDKKNNFVPIAFLVIGIIAAIVTLNVLLILINLI
jgi:hypothetical protein